MPKIETLADYLGTPGPDPQADTAPRLEDIAGDAETFCKAVLNSREFRRYIVNGLTLGELPSAIMIRLMDMAGWQKPPDRVEHTGKDGQPIVTEVRRVLVHVAQQEEDDAKRDAPRQLTH